MSLKQRGFVLIELLVATLITTAVAILVGKLLLDSAAVLRNRSERMGLEQAVRVSAGAARAMLEPLGIDPGSGADLMAAGPSSFVARIVRGAGVLCDAALDRVLLRAGPTWWWGVRIPVKNRDSIIVATVAGAERWIVAPLLGNPAASTCPDGSSATLLPTAIPLSSLPSLGSGSPLQVFEPVELRIYPSAGASWLGLRLTATGEAIQPLAGPFAPAGSGLGYRDRQGGFAATPFDVAMVTVGLEGVTERAGGVGLARAGRASSDSVSIAVSLRGRP